MVATDTPELASPAPSQDDPAGPLPGSELDQLLDEARAKKGMTWGELAEAAGISVQALGKIRKGSRPKYSTQRQLEEALGLPRHTILRLLAPPGWNGELRTEVKITANIPDLHLMVVRLKRAYPPEDSVRLQRLLQAVADAYDAPEDK